MIVKSVNGFIKYFPQEPDDLIRFKRMFGMELFAENDYFTFKNLIGLPRHSIAGLAYGTFVAIKTYEGRSASDVMLANGIVYSLQTGNLVPMLSLPNSVKINDGQFYGTVAYSFLQPGARLDGEVDRVLSYSAWLSMDYQKLYVFDRELV